MFYHNREIWVEDELLRTRVLELIDSTKQMSSHEDFCELLRRFPTSDLERFVELWPKVDPSMLSALVRFVVAGDDPNGEFLEHLDKSKECQEAVDLAFRAHIESLHDLGRSVAKAEETLKKRKEGNQDHVSSLLTEADKAEDALESMEEELEGMVKVESSNETTLTPILNSVHKALSALGMTKESLQTLSNK